MPYRCPRRLDRTTFLPKASGERYVSGSDEHAAVCFGQSVAKVLRTLPARGPLVPYMRGVRAADRATALKQRCRLR